MQRNFDLSVVIGRFQPIHNGHLSTLLHALSIADDVLILIGSSFQPRTIKNPFTFDERKQMIDSSLRSAGVDPMRYRIEPIRDFLYEDTKWAAQVVKKAADANAKKSSNVCIVGHDKDESTYYLKMFPQFEHVDPGMNLQYRNHAIDATQLRDLLFTKKTTFLKGAMPELAFNFIVDFTEHAEFQTLVNEYVFINQYKKQWANSPYPPSFNTVDAVLIQGGHVLLIERKAAPGQGLLALPGGFVDPQETLEAAMLRELREETRVKIPEPILRSNIRHRQMFDHPSRSLRGRTFSEAFLIEVPLGPDGKLAPVKGGDDAASARWYTIQEALDLSERLFEDHHSIISTMVARAK